MNKKPYALQLAAKQKLRQEYGDISEHTLRRIHDISAASRGQTISGMIARLENRLETAVFRLNFAPSIKSARQLIKHRKIRVNGKIVTAPSYELRIGDEIEIQEGMANSLQVQMVNAKHDVPTYFEVLTPDRKGKYINTPNIEDVPYSENVEPNLVIEFYAR